MESILVCPNCGQKNKVKDDAAEAKCGKCWASLKTKTKNNETESKSTSYAWLVWLVVIGAVIFVINLNDTKKDTR